MNIVPVNKNNLQRVDISNFTDDQRIAYDNLIEFITNEYNESDYKRALTGPAGTGKTYLVNALIRNSGLSYSTIGLAAPTHKACRVLGESIKLPNIKVNTLQSDLGLRINFDVDKFDIKNPPFDPKGRIKIKEYKIYIVDEASMINRGLLTFLEKICKENHCKILYIGDASQLPPVGEKYSAAFRGVKLYALKEIVRQGEDNPISYLLELLRDDVEHKTYKFLNYIQQNPCKFNTDGTKGYQVCNSDTFNKLVYINFNDENLTHNIDFCKIMAYTNNVVSAWNKVVRNSIIEKADTSVITKNDLILSYTTIVNQFNDCVIKNSEEYILKDIVNYSHPKYELKGFVVRFMAIHGGASTTPLFILDHSDRFTMQRYMQISDNMINAAKSARANMKAQRWRDYYAFKESCLLLTNILGTDGKILFGRDLDYGFALTAHKSQGSTFDTAFVDVNDIVYDKYGYPYADAEEVNRRLYVACSRCKNKLYLKFGR